MRVSLDKHRSPGQLIAVCGADGTGKSTAIDFFVAAMKKQNKAGVDILRLRQPSDWWRSDPHVASTLMHQGNSEVFDEFALGVFGLADRFNQQALVIKPALAAGRTVIVDRYLYCLLAYFMATREPLLSYLVSMCEPLIEPNITFVIDCPPEVAVGRVVSRDGPHPERADQQIDRTSAFIDSYRSLAELNELHLLSSLEPPRAVSESMLKIYDNIFY